jgi:hypothetical protein
MPLTTVSPGLLDSNAQYNSFKNRIINGAMMIDQRNAGASVTLASSSYTLDRWRAGMTAASKFSVQKNAGAVSPPEGFTNYLGVTSLSSYALTASDVFNISQRIEGFNTADLNFGTANAQTVTLSFWVRSSLTGTFGGSFQNASADRSYPFTFTISSANTFEYKTVNIAGDTSGTWLTTNGNGITLNFSLGSGSTYSGTAGAWAGADYRSATGATSVVGTNGATFYITGVQLEKGSTATSFDYRPYGTELSLCQRYAIKYLGTGNYEKIPAIPFCTGTTSVTAAFVLPVIMRTSPSITQSTLAVSTTGGSQSISAVAVDHQSTASPSFTFTSSGLTANNAVLLQANNSTSAYVILSAEL